MTMCGPDGVLQPGCGVPGGKPGALISAQKEWRGATTVVSSVTITVGNKATATGNFYMEGGVTAYGAETGAKIITDSTTGKSGNITITAGKTYFTEPGSVVQSGFAQRHDDPDWGQDLHRLRLRADDRGTHNEQGSGSGRRPRPPRVLRRHHPRSGRVDRQGPRPPPRKNSCDNVNDGLPGEVFRDHPDESTGCIEVWGNFITIDSFNLNPATGLPWAGELNADIGNGGADGTSWIDIFAFSKLTVIDGTGNDFVQRQRRSHLLLDLRRARERDRRLRQQPERDHGDGQERPADGERQGLRGVVDADRRHRPQPGTLSSSATAATAARSTSRPWAM